MKIDAGWKLYHTNPTVAPASDHAAEACAQAPCCAKVSPRKNEAIAPTPAATPSRPSSRLKALVSATNQSRVATTLVACHGVTGKTAPSVRSATPASSWSRNLACGRSRRMSSTNPTTHMNAALSPRPRAGRVVAASDRTAHPFPTSNVAAARPARVANTMATPPSNAVGCLCHRSADGCATAPARTARARTAGVNTRPATSDVPRITPIARRTLMARAASLEVRASRAAFHHTTPPWTGRRSARELTHGDGARGQVIQVAA